MKPPIGLRPRTIANEQRVQEIKEAIIRYADAGKLPPLEWIQEMSDLKKEIIELAFCEQNQVILKENQLYRFTADPHCEDCQELKAVYPEEPAELFKDAVICDVCGKNHSDEVGHCDNCGTDDWIQIDDFADSRLVLGQWKKPVKLANRD